MRTEDLLSISVAFIKDRELESLKQQKKDENEEQETDPEELLNEVLNVISVGETGVPTLHAAALHPGLYFKVTIRDSLTTWQSVIETPVTIRQLENTVHGALKFYDLPDLIELAGPDKVTIESPRDATGNLISLSK